MTESSGHRVAVAGAGAAVVRGASVLIILQVASRAVTFLANQLLLRFLTPELLGVATQLEVYYLSVLFFSRESLRVAVQRGAASVQDDGRDRKKRDDGHGQRDKADQQSQAVVNLGYLALALGCPVAVALGGAYLTYVDPATREVPNLDLSLKLYGLAAIVELAAEPCFVLMQTRLRFGVRAAAESAATFARCAGTVAAAVWAARAGVSLGVLPFAAGQLLYGLSLLAVYVWHGLRMASRDGFSLTPRPVGAGKTDPRYLWSLLYRPTISLASSMTAQSIVKHVLTQGDTFLVSALSTPTAQGVYALANNYGGLLARLVFQPVEENTRSYFSRLLSANQPAANDKQGTPGPDKGAAQQASRSLHNLVRLYVVLSAVVVAVGPLLAPHLLALVAGSRWMDDGAGEALATYCYYLPLLAINGVAEAFVASVATEAEVHRQSIWMAAFSCAFGAAGFVFLRVMSLGAVGLVYANAINMACRIVWSAVFIKRYFARFQVQFNLASLRPGHATTLLCLAAPHFISRLSSGIPLSNPTAFTNTAKLAVVAAPFVLLL